MKHIDMCYIQSTERDHPLVS